MLLVAHNRAPQGLLVLGVNHRVMARAADRGIELLLANQLLAAREIRIHYHAIDRGALGGMGGRGVAIIDVPQLRKFHGDTAMAGAVIQHDDDDVRFDAVTAGASALSHLQQQSEPVLLAQTNFLVTYGPVARPRGQCSPFKHRYRAPRRTPERAVCSLAVWQSCHQGLVGSQQGQSCIVLPLLASGVTHTYRVHPRDIIIILSR